MNKKIGIITITDYKNYGNRLQNFAAQEVLKSLGFSVETIVNDNTHSNSLLKSDILMRTKTFSIIANIGKLSFAEISKKVFLRVYNYINKYKFQKLRDKRIKAFKEFTKKYIVETNYCISENNIPKNISINYDYFVTGSDQVWNPYFRNGSPIDFLTFASRDKRIAYAPSFGVSEIPSEYQDIYKMWLSEFSSLSVREDAGAAIIKKLTHRDASVLVDPTLMLTKEKWLSISKPDINKPRKKYLLTYFLGSIPAENKNRIRRIAKENDLEIVRLADLNNRKPYITGPSEFIDYIRYASVFCTDSFHGVVFSLLMETPFIVFDRIGNVPSMNSRIETLLSKFKLESRFEYNIKDNKQVFEANYSHVSSILEEERKKALDYLKKALGIQQ